MFGRSLRIGSILGVPIFLDWTWFLVFGLATFSLASGYFPSMYPAWTQAQYWLTGALTSILLFVSVLAHELGHAVMARAYRVPVERITLFIFGGVAQLGGETRTAISEFMIAIIGPLTSAALAAVFYLLQLISGDISQPATGLLRYLALINLTLAVFNLIPGFPLDGGRVLRSIIWGITRNLSKATIIAVRVGQLIAFGFVAFGAWRMLTGSFSNGLWLGFIGMFLKTAADTHLRAQQMRDLLSNYQVAQAMNRNTVTVPPNISVRDLVEQYILGSGQPAVIVKSNGHAEGLLTVQDIREVPREKWSSTTAAELVGEDECCDQVTPETDLWEALEQMDRKGYKQLMVERDGSLLGLLTRADVMSFLKSVEQLRVGAKA